MLTININGIDSKNKIHKIGDIVINVSNFIGKGMMEISAKPVKQKKKLIVCIDDLLLDFQIEIRQPGEWRQSPIN